VDCGITAVGQAEIAKKLGIDLIITDHHQPQDKLPEPFSLIHTTSLSGSGIAFRLAESLLASFGKEKDEQFFKNLELATLGTVADMVPLTFDNRIIVRNGLSLLSKTERLGLKSLYEEAEMGRSVGTYEIGFIISPRLNAAGRMENAFDSLRLLLTRDPSRSRDLARSLGKTNKDRQDKTKRVFDDAKKQVEERFSESRFLTISSKDYPEGVVGLVASRLVETFYRPTAVIGKGEQVFKGSARSIANFNITRAIHTQEEILVSHGGHPMAAGFSIEEPNIKILRQNLENIAQSEISKEDLVPQLKIDLELNLGDINQDLIALIREFEPFGVGNSEPIFMTKNLQVVQVRRVGNEGQHLRVSFRSKEGKDISGVGFGLGGKNLANGDFVDVVYNLRENVWNSRKTIEARIKDIKASTVDK
jgi:single-stranded-DNA-specific exonuclease